MRWSWILVSMLVGCGTKDGGEPAVRSGSNAPSGGAIAAGSGSATPPAEGSATVTATDTSMKQPEPPPTKIEQLFAFDEAVLARTSEGKVYAWGTNQAGTVGDGTGKPRPAPVLVLSDVAQLAASWQVACARMRDGSVQCWGENEWRQAGHPSARTRNAPGPIAGVTGATAIFVEAVRACASVDGGKLVCWGNVEPSGLWSERHETKTAKPVEVKGITDVAQIDDDCVRHTDGTVTCWGMNLSPRKIGGITAATHIEDDCARMDGGRVACWGANDQCRLGKRKHGDSADDSYATAQPMAVKQAAQTFDGGCALTDDGSLWCHGACDDPKLKQLALGNVQRVVERCVIFKDTSVACSNKWVGSPYERLAFAPKPVPGLSNVTRLAVASDVACAVVGDSDLWCWGDRKKRGLVGDGTKQPRELPVHVLGAAGPVAAAGSGAP